MQVTLKPETPAEVRLIAAFLQDHADLMEIPETKPAESKPAATRGKPAATKGKPAATEEPPPAATEETGAKVSVDTLRTLFGDLAQAGKREAAVALVKGYGFNAIKEISEDKRDEIHAKLAAL